MTEQEGLFGSTLLSCAPRGMVALASAAARGVGGFGGPIEGIQPSSRAVAPSLGSTPMTRPAQREMKSPTPLPVAKRKRWADAYW